MNVSLIFEKIYHRLIRYTEVFYIADHEFAIACSKFEISDPKWGLKIINNGMSSQYMAVKMKMDEKQTKNTQNRELPCLIGHFRRKL